MALTITVICWPDEAFVFCHSAHTQHALRGHGWKPCRLVWEEHGLALALLLLAAQNGNTFSGCLLCKNYLMLHFCCCCYCSSTAIAQHERCVASQCPAVAGIVSCAVVSMMCVYVRGRNFRHFALEPCGEVSRLLARSLAAYLHTA